MTVAATALAALDLLGAIIFPALLAATFPAQGIIVRKTRQFALDKSQNPGHHHQRRRGKNMIAGTCARFASIRG